MAGPLLDYDLLERLGVGIGIILAQIWSTFKQRKDLRKISKEFEGNGGKTIRDSLDRIELRLVLSEARVRALVSNNGQMLFEANADGMWVWANKELCDKAGRSVDDLNGNGWVNIIHVEDRDRVYKEWQTAINQNREFDLLFKCNDRFGSILSVKGHSYLLKDDNNKTYGYVGILSPVNTASTTN